jgi:hypothetical protein
MPWSAGERVTAGKLNMYRAKYRATDTQTIATATDTLIQFSIAVATTPVVAPGGVNNSFFTLQPGLWDVRASFRISQDTNFEWFMLVGNSFAIGSIRSGDSGFRNAFCSMVEEFSSPSPVSVSIYQGSGANRFPQVFGELPSITMIRLQH